MYIYIYTLRASSSSPTPCSRIGHKKDRLDFSRDVGSRCSVIQPAPSPERPSFFARFFACSFASTAVYCFPIFTRKDDYAMFFLFLQTAVYCPRNCYAERKVEASGHEMLRQPGMIGSMGKLSSIESYLNNCFNRREV